MSGQVSHTNSCVNGGSTSQVACMREGGGTCHHEGDFNTQACMGQTKGETVTWGEQCFSHNPHYASYNTFVDFGMEGD